MKRNYASALPGLRTAISVAFLGCLLSLLFLRLPAQGFQRTWGFTGNDYASGLTSTSDGGFAVIGRTNSFGAGDEDFLVMKFDANGQVQWTRTLGQFTTEWGYTIKELQGGGYWVGGSTNSVGAGMRDHLIMRLNAAGNLTQTRTYGGDVDEDTRFSTLRSNNNLVFTSYSNSLIWGPGGADLMLSQINPAGALVWSYVYGDTANEFPTSIDPLPNEEGYFLTGYRRNYQGFSIEGLLFEADSSGTLQWVKHYDSGFDDYFLSSAPTSDGGHLIAGISEGTSAGVDVDGLIVKVDSLGGLQFARTYGGGDDDFFRTIIPTNDGNFLVVGSTFSFGNGNRDILAMKITEQGNVLWARAFGGAAEEDIGGSREVVRETPGGAFTIAGYTQSFGAGGVDVYLVQVDANGSSGCNETNIALAPTPLVMTEYLDTFVTQATPMGANSAMFTTIPSPQDSFLCCSITLSLNDTAYLCPGDSVVLDAGYAGATYLWSNGDTTQTSTVSSTGTFWVQATDSNGCFASDTTIVVQNQPISLSFNSTNATCAGNDGTVQAVASGGTGQFAYLWSPGGQTTDTLQALSAGTYTVTVTDTGTGPVYDTVFWDDFEAVATAWTLNTSTGTNGATNNQWQINDNEGGMPVGSCGTALNGDETMHITCTSAGCGTILTGALYNATIETNLRAETPDINTVGRTNMLLEFTFISNGDALLDNASVLYSPDGGLTWNVLDNSIKSNVCVTGQGEWALAQYALPAVCENIPNLRIGFNWTNNADNVGTDPSVAINNVLITRQLPPVQACAVTDSVTITAGSLNISASSTDVSCAGDSNGTAAVSVLGGSGTYGYLWQPGGQTTDSVSGLAPGTYTVYITDSAAGPGNPTLDSLFFDDFETAPTSWILNTPTGPNNATPNIWTISDDEGGVPPPGCGTASNGDETMHITCTSLFCGSLLTGALYNATTESNTRTETPNISTLGRSNIELSFDFISLGDALLDNCDVEYSDDGGLTWNVVDPSIKTVNCVTGQGQWAARNYALPANCSNIPNLRIGFVWTNNADNAGSDPSVAINNVLVTGQDTVSSTGLCLDSITVTIGEPTALALVTGTDSSGCGDSTGVAFVAASGGTPGYSYLWNTNPVQSNDSALGIPSGTYQVVVTDSNGCQDSAQATVFNLNGPTVSIDTVVDPTCGGGSDGFAVVNIVGGSTPYNILWNTNPFQTTDTAFGLAAGSYQVVVTDTSGCADSATAVVNPSPGLGTNFVFQEPRCGQDNGLIIAASSGNVGPVSYTWNTTPPTLNDSLINIGPGTYIVQSLDSIGCTGTDTITLDSLTPPQVNITGVNPVSCNGLSDGSASALVTGGAGTINYSWNGGSPSTFPTLNNVPAGPYTVVVTDSVGCVDSASTNITEPPAIQLSLSSTAITCFGGGADGTATVVASGGSGGFTYAWSSGGTAATETNLPPGPVSVTVTDANGCVATSSVTISSQGTPIVDAGPTVAFCEGDGGAQLMGSASSGSPGYYWDWWCDSTNTNCGLSFPHTPTPTANPSVSTTYYVQVFDTNGCPSNIDSVVVQVLPKPVVDAGPDINLCFPASPCEQFNPTVSNAPGPYTYNWSPGIGLNDSTIANPCARPNSTTIYTLQVTASNGCASDVNTLDTNSTVVAYVNPTPVAHAGPDLEICEGDTVRLTGFGSNSGPNYRYQWTPAVNISDPSVQNPLVWPSLTTDYSLVVYSAGNCPSFADTVRVTVHTRPTGNAGNARDICLGETTLLDGSASGDSTATYSYSWSPTTGMLGNPTDEDVLVSPDSTTTYTMVATSNYGCESPPQTVLVRVKPTPQAEAGPPIYLCPNDSGAILLGGYFYTTTDTAPDPTQIRYDWNPINGLQPGGSVPRPFANPGTSTMYYLTVSYNTCSTLDSVAVTVHPDFGDSIWADTTTICGEDSVQLHAIGGQGAADFSWIPPTGLSNPNIPNPWASPDQTTTYFMALEEGGCTDTLAITLNVIPQPEVEFLSSQTEGCEDFTVNFLEVAGLSSAYVWDFGDGSPVSNEQNPVHTYPDPGQYWVTLSGVGLGGCKTESAPRMITVFEGADAGFSSNPSYPVEFSLPTTTVEFRDESSNGVSWFWDFGDGNSSTEQHPTHTYLTAGTYFVTLTVITENGCQETIEHGPYLVKAPELFIPNVFSPNGDGINDLFLVEYSGSQPFQMEVFDRWGTLMYSTVDKMEGWNGTFQGTKAQAGVYFVTVKIGPKEYAGNVTLVR